ASSIAVFSGEVHIADITEDENGDPLQLFGWSVDPIVFTSDDTRAYVVGTGNKIYAVDTASLTVFDTLDLSEVVGSSSILSLVIDGDGLYAALGSRSAALSEGAPRLVRIDIATG